MADRQPRVGTRRRTYEKWMNTSAGRLVRKETAINTVVTAVIAAVLSWVIFRNQTDAPALAAPPGGIFGILPGTFNFSLLVTIGLTLVIRGRVRGGAAARLAPTDGSQVGSSLPANVVVRGLVLALLATLTFVPLAGLAVWTSVRTGLVPSGWTLTGMLLFYVVYFVVLSLVITPIIVWRALRD